MKKEKDFPESGDGFLTGVKSSRLNHSVYYLEQSSYQLNHSSFGFKRSSFVLGLNS
jgi:hypothetical protein